MRAAGVALLASFFGVSCGDPPPPPPPKSVELAALCEEVAKTECARLERCGHLLGAIDRAECERREKEARCRPVIDVVLEAVTAMHATYDPIQGGHCVDEIAAAACEVGLDHRLFAGEECRSMMTGLRAENESCFFAASCQDGLYCNASGGQCPGTCQRFRQNNEECGGGQFCASEFFCAATQLRCLGRVGRGQPCAIAINGDNSCVDDSFCDPNIIGGPKCMPALGRQNGCRSDHECVSGLRCLAGLCSGGEPNDTCESSADCELGLLCTSTRRCQAPLAPDATCTSNGVPCREGFTCTSSAGASTCRAIAKIGEACSAEKPCYLGRCQNGACALPASDGAACANATDCYPNRSCEAQTCKTALLCRI